MKNHFPIFLNHFVPSAFYQNGLSYQSYTILFHTLCVVFVLKLFKLYMFWFKSCIFLDYIKMMQKKLVVNDDESDIKEAFKVFKSSY